MTSIELVRPGPAAEAWLDGRIAELRGDDPLRPVTVVVPNHYAGLHLRRRLAARSYANIRATILARLAEIAGAPVLAGRGLLPLTAVTEEAAIRAAVREAGGLGPQSDHRAVVTTLRRLFRDLADRDPEPEERDQLAAAGGLAAVALAAHAAYRRILKERRLYDAGDLYQAAMRRVEDDPKQLLEEWGPVVLYLPNRLSLPQLRFVNAIDTVGPLAVAFPWLGDELADAEPRLWITKLGGFAKAAPPTPANQEGRGDLGGEVPAVLMAPDAGEEVRAVVRMILSGLEAGLPLHRTAVVYRNAEPYKQLVRETLTAADLPCVGLDGKPLTESFAGRGLVGLLNLQSRRFSRAAVLDWLSSLPHGGSGPSLAQWDRISRDAGVVRTVKQWHDRLELKLGEDRSKLAKLEQAGDDSTLPLQGFLRSEIGAAEQMQRRIQEMDRLTRPGAGGWVELTGWAKRVRTELVPTKGWPEPEKEAAQLVDEVLDGLITAAELDPEVTVERFVETLEESLRSRRRPEGRLSQGVVTGPIAAIAGMTFDRVYVVGMTERAYPAPPPVDPLFPWNPEHDPLGRVARGQSAERLAYLGALVSSKQAVLCYPTHDTEQRPAYPARWLLDAVSELAGRRVGPKELREMKEGPPTPWLRSIVSTAEALQKAPEKLNLAERRVAEAAGIVAGRGDLANSALARRDDLPVGRALEAAGERMSHEFSEFDGNVAAVAGQVKRLEGGLSRLHPISASGIETWAACPFRYFLGRVLEIEPTQRPEDEEAWSISPIDRGSLIHGILEEFFSRLAAEGRPAADEAYTRVDRERLEEIAQDAFRQLEAHGQTGYRLAWLNEQGAIRLDLQSVLKYDEEFRREHALKPEFFEQRFGWEEREGGWPAAEIELSDGTVVRLHGFIDRVDLGDGEAYVTDYKTGILASRKDFEEDPVVAGTKVQLAVYSKAVRRYLEESGRPAGRVTAAYWFISPKGKFQRIEVADPAASDRRLTDVVEVVNRGLLAGAFPQVPGEEEGWTPKRPGWANCRFCDYHRICPTGRDLIHDRKAAQPGAELVEKLILR